MTAAVHYSQGVDYLGFLSAKLRDLRGFPALANELIQNADDVSEATEIVFDVTDPAMIVYNDGKFAKCDTLTADQCPWEDDPAHGRLCDFHRLRRVASGDKRREAETTGAFGIGIISVYQVTDAPELISSGQYWTIRPEMDESQRIEGWSVAESPGTTWTLPWASDPESPLRRRLDAEPVNTDHLESIASEIGRLLPHVALFLQRLERLKVCLRGEVVRSVHRLTADDQVIVETDGRQQVWTLLRGEFIEESETLRRGHPQIEAAKQSKVELAIPLAGELPTGVLAATLPTEHRTSLPFHVNADFYTSSDRRRAILDDDFQGRWNKLALKCASETLADAIGDLRESMGPDQFWAFLARVNDAGGIGRASGGDEASVGFWTHVVEKLPNIPCVYTADGDWVMPEEAFLLEQEEEEEAESVLTDLGLSIVNRSLRRHFSLLSSKEVGVPFLTALNVARSVQEDGSRRAEEGAEVAEWLQKNDARAVLAREIERLLLSRRSREDAKEQAREILRQCRIAVAADGTLQRPLELLVCSERDAKVFTAIGLQKKLAGKNERGVQDLIPELDAGGGVALLNAVAPEALTAMWKSNNQTIIDLIDWLASHENVLSADESLQSQVRALRTWPSAGELASLDSLVLPGDFEDELGLASIIDMKALPGRRDFVRSLGVKALDIATYVTVQVPQAMGADPDLPVEKRRKVLLLIAHHVGDLRDNKAAQKAIAKCPLVECKDGTFRSALDVYFQSNDVAHSLPGSHIAVPSIESPEAVESALEWMGVMRHPRSEDVIERIREITKKDPTEEHSEQISLIIEYLGRRYLDVPDEFDLEYGELRSMRWLPVIDGDVWRAPRGLYATYRRYLFASQADFLNINRDVEKAAVGVLGFIGVGLEPPPELVVKHLLLCANEDQEVNQAVYRFLDDNVDDDALQVLKGRECLYLRDRGFRSAKQVFWGSHGFGRFRFQLDAEFRSYQRLLEFLGVRDSPSAEDAIQVLLEIAQEFGEGNRTLDSEAQQVVQHCWELLDNQLRIEPEFASELSQLRTQKVIVNDQKILYAPTLLLLEDRPRVAEIFRSLLGHNLIPKHQSTWHAMVTAGVRTLSEVTRRNLVECDGATEDADLDALLRNRRQLIARIVEARGNTNGSEARISSLDQLAVRRASLLMVQYEIDAFKKVAAEAESVSAFYDEHSHTLYAKEGTGSSHWSSVARQLAYLLLPEVEPGPLAAGLKEVLTAESLEVADRALDDLGYAPIEVGVAVVPEAETVGLGTDEDVEDWDDTAWDVSPRDVAEIDSESEPTVEPANAIEQTPPPVDVTRRTETPGGERTAASVAGSRGARQRPQRRAKLRSYVLTEDHETPRDSDLAATERIRETDRIGMARCIRAERKAGRTPRRMRQTHPGYDIESRERDSDKVRYIEVKSLEGSWVEFGVGMTATQYEHARQHGDNYWLYVVENCRGDDYEITRIRNPASKASEYRFDDGWRGIGELDGDGSAGNLA